MIIGACLLAVGLLWFALASSPSIDPLPQILAGVPIGAGVQVVLLQSLAYLIDIYTTNANSAISGTVVVRSLIGGGFPLFAVPMYQRLGVCFLSLPFGLRCRLLMRRFGEGVLGFKHPWPLRSLVHSYSRTILSLRSEGSLVQQIRSSDLTSQPKSY